MSIDQSRLVLDEVSRTEEALNYVYTCDSISSSASMAVVLDSSGNLTTEPFPALVPGAIVAVRDNGISDVAKLYALVYVNFDTDPDLGAPTKTLQWKVVDMDWPKIDPNTGKYDNINLVSTDPDYVNPALR